MDFVPQARSRGVAGLLVLMLSACATTPSGTRSTAKIGDIRDHKPVPTIQARPTTAAPALVARPVPSVSEVETRPLRSVPEPVVAMPDNKISPRMPDVETMPVPPRGGFEQPSDASSARSTERELPLASRSEPFSVSVPALAKLESLPSVTLPPQNNRAVASLLAVAERQKKAGELEGAVATLERALSIEPRNSVIWSRMAELRFEQGRYDQAAQLAAKSNLFVGTNMVLQARNYRLVALAKDTMGDRTAAAAALRQAEQLEEMSQ